MKKLLLIAFIITMPFFTMAQTFDSDLFELKRNGTDGKFSLLQNKGVYYGKAAGTVIMPLYFHTPTIDTSAWGFVPIGSDGSFRIVENKDTWMGKDSGTVRAVLIYDVSSDTVYYAANMYHYAHEDSTNTFSQTQTFTGTVLLKSDSDWVDAGGDADASITGTGQKGVLYVDNVDIVTASVFELTFNNTVITTGASVNITLRSPNTSPWGAFLLATYTYAKQNGQIKVAIFNDHPTDHFLEDFIIDYLILP